MRQYNTLFKEIESVKTLENLKSVLKQVLDEVSEHENRINNIEEDLDIEEN